MGFDLDEAEDGEHGLAHQIAVEVEENARCVRERLLERGVRVADAPAGKTVRDEMADFLFRIGVDALFTADKPVIFAFHGYPWLIHRLTYRRTNHHNIHVRGYKEEGTTTTPFDMVMLNDLDRYHLVMDVIDRVPGLSSSAGHVRQLMVDKRIEARAYTREQGEDAPEVANWTWPS